MLKKVLLFISLFIISIGFVGCKNNDKVTVGVLITATHGALESAKDGFIEQLKANGYENAKIIVKNPEGDTTTMNSMATDLIRKSDIVLGIGTPAAVALQSARNSEQIDIDILFTAVTDPVSSGLMKDANAPTDITGTSDMNPVEEQINLIKEINPDVKKIGVIYNIAETNSKVQAELVEKQAQKLGIEVVIKTISEAMEMTVVTTTLIQNDGVEAIYLPTDNLVASNTPLVTAISNEFGVMTVCGESALVNYGGTISYSIDYHELGKLTGQMAVDILNGKSCSQIPCATVDDSGLVIAVNQKAIEEMGIELPQSIKDKIK